MNLCTTDKIDPNDGDYLLLVDYRNSGFGVQAQSTTLDGILAAALLGENYGNPMAIVKLVRVSITEENP